MLDAGAVGVREALADLSGRGMLHRVVIADADAGGKCFVLEEGRLREVDIFGFLAGLQLDLVRLISLSLSGESLHPDVLSFVDQIQKQLQPGGIVLDKYSIVVPKTSDEVDERAFYRYWNYNLLVEPADMAGESGFSQVQIDNEAKQSIIGTSVVCMLGALWKWLEESPLDDNRIRAAVGNVGVFDDDGRGPRLRIIRLVTRIVDAGNVTMQAIARALSPGVQLPPPVGCSRHGDPQSFITGVSKAMFESSDPFGFGLCYRPFPGESIAAPTKIGPIEAIKLFFTEVGRVLSGMPAEFIDRKTAAVSKRIEDFVAARTFGSDSRLVVSLEAGDQRSLVLDPAKRISGIAISSTGSEGSISPSPQTWIGLANLTFAIVDANEHHGVRRFQIPSWDGSPAVVTDFSVMAPSGLLDGQAGRFRFDENELALLGIDSDYFELRIFDAAGLRDVTTRIDQCLKRAETQKRPVVEEGAAAKADSAATNSEQGEGDKLALEMNLDKDAAERLKSLKNRLTEWRQPVEPTFLWKAADGIVGEVTRATRDYEEAESRLVGALETLDSASQENAKSVRRFRKKLLIVVALVIISVLGGVAGFVLLPILSTLIGVGVIALGLFASLVMIYRAARERVRDQYRAQSLSNSLERTFGQRTHAVMECHRLNSLYVQFLDWAEIIGAVLLRPLGSISVASEAPWGSTSGALSLVSGVPVINDSRSRSLTLSVMQHLVSRGWMTRSYFDRRSRVLSGYHDQFDLAPGSVGSPEADHGLNQDALFVLPGDAEGTELAVFPPRRTLHDAILDGAFTRQMREEQVARINSTGLAKDQVTIVDSVKCEVPGLSNPPRSVKDFLEPILRWRQIPDFTDMLTPARAVSGVQVLSVVGASQALGDVQTLEEQIRVPIASIPDRYTLATFRLDVSDAMPLTDIQLLKISHSTETNNEPHEQEAPEDPNIENLG